MQSWIFSIITPVFNDTWSFKYNDLILNIFLLLSMLKTVALLNIFVETVINFISRFFNEYKVQKNSIYLKYKLLVIFLCILAE